MLKFIYGTMNSAKSANLLIKAYQLEESGYRVLLLKSATDTRDLGLIKSRIGLARRCELFAAGANLYELIPTLVETYSLSKPKWQSRGKIVIMIDECQFCTEEQIHQLRRLLMDYHYDIYCYGLKTNYQNRCFEAAAELFALADTIEHLPSPCCNCGQEASTHLRYVDDVPVFDGAAATVGDIVGKTRYEAVCQECWYKVYTID